jgi:NADH:ubiquinone oxidoreductase subunit B-like Fe-S oxidoreductase
VVSLFLKILKTGVVTEPLPGAEPETAQVLRRIQEEVRRRLGRSLAIREVDAGSCNGCEIDITALGNPVYDCERFGLRFVASPRHADMLLVTGPVT